MHCSTTALMTAFLIAISGIASAASLPAWRDGDLVFQQSRSPQSEAIRIASASRYTHMGMVRLTPKGPVVIEASRVVTQTPLKDFLARGVGGRFAVYRARALSPAQGEKVIRAALGYLGRPYDPYFRFDSEAIYCSELPYYAFQSAGISLGHSDRFGDLAIHDVRVKALFMARWLEHPDCKRAARNAASCWALVQGQSMITPVSIAKDGQLDRIYSNF